MQSIVELVGTLTAEAVPEAVPEVAPEAVPEVAPEAAPEVAPEAAPEVAPEAAPGAAPEVAPGAAPGAAPGVKARVTGGSCRGVQRGGGSKPRKAMGQTGRPITLTSRTINDKERRVIKALCTRDTGVLSSIAELAGECFPDEGRKANSWVRNSLRRLVRGGWVARVDRGSYEATVVGRRGSPR